MKLTFDEALERVNDQRYVSSSDVQARALQRYVWLAEWHLPGCLSDGQSVCLSKHEAIESCLSMASGEAGPPRGMATDLRRFGSSNRTAPDAYVKGAISTVQRCMLRELL